MKKNRNSYLFDQYLSLKDLELLEDWESVWLPIWKAQDEATFMQLLYQLGADLELGYEVDVCNHRPRTQKQTYYGVRFSFMERQDQYWKGHMMELEDVIRTTEDEDLKEDLTAMSKRLTLKDRFTINPAAGEEMLKNVERGG